MYASNGYGDPPCLFKSTNGGIDWDPAWGTDVSQYLAENFAQGFDMDPTNPQHLVVSFHENCTGAYAPFCLAETTDDAATWRVFKGPTILVNGAAQGWEEAAQVTVLGPTTFVYAAPFNGLFYTKDSGATWQTVANDAWGLIFTMPPIVDGGSGTMLLGSAQHGTLRSDDSGQTWMSIPASPLATSVYGDGITLFSSFGSTTTGQPIYSAPYSNPNVWTNVKTPTMSSGAEFGGYDPDHHILYANNYGAGLWRVVTH